MSRAHHQRRPALRVAQLALLLLATASAACTFKSAGPARAANYDYSEFEVYDQPHASSPVWESGLPENR